MTKTSEMTKQQLAEALADHRPLWLAPDAAWTPPSGESRDWSVGWYIQHMTKHELLTQVEYVRGERTQDQLVYKYDS
jgi:hypothetical protein